MVESDQSARLELAIAAAREAGKLALRYFGQDNYQVELKADASPVTIADREAEHLLRERIAVAFPDDAILGEELPERPGRSGYRWILDPIDGTKSFVHGVPLYGTLIGVELAERSVVGVVYMPALDEMVYAADGQGAWHVVGDRPPRRAQVSKCATLAEALFCTTAPGDFAKLNRREPYEKLEQAARLTRTWGDCYGYLLVATGRAEVMVDPIMNAWDAAPMQPILEEAGGTFTNWQGEPTIHSREGIATNGRVLAEVLAITGGY